MPDPVSLDEFNRLSQERTRIEGYGLDVATHAPCPFCAHPEFMVLMPAAGLADDRPPLEETMRTEHVCEGCGRGGRVILERTERGTFMEFVQTRGDEPAEWLVPKPRRVEEG